MKILVLGVLRRSRWSRSSSGLHAIQQRYADKNFVIVIEKELAADAS